MLRRFGLSAVFLASDAREDDEDFALLLQSDLPIVTYPAGVLRDLSMDDPTVPSQSDSLTVMRDPLSMSSSLPMMELWGARYADSPLSDGERAAIDQLLCINADIFVGTRESTFTTRIWEERYAAT